MVKDKSLAIGQRLRTARLALGVSQRDFAQLLRTTPNHVCQIERGRCIPGGRLLRGMHLYYGIDINWLLTGVQDLAATSVLSRDLTVLVSHYQRADRQGKTILCRAAEFVAQASGGTKAR